MSFEIQNSFSRSALFFRRVLASLKSPGYALTLTRDSFLHQVAKAAVIYAPTGSYGCAFWVRISTDRPEWASFNFSHGRVYCKKDGDGSFFLRKNVFKKK